MTLLNKNLTKSQEYDSAAALAKEVGEQMIARLDGILFQPKRILEMGCKTGFLTRLLRKRFPETTIIATDNDIDKLHYLKQHPISANVISCEESLSLQSQSVDMIFANLSVVWAEDINRIFDEWKRILTPNGLVMFSCFGPSTFSPWQKSFMKNLNVKFYDMHDMGDALVRANLINPVLDVDYITLTYSSLDHVLSELMMTEMINLTLAEKEDVIINNTNLPNSQNRWSITYEVIFAHAWRIKEDDHQIVDAEGSIKIPIAQFKKMLNG